MKNAGTLTATRRPGECGAVSREQVARAPRYAITLSAEIRTNDFRTAGVTRNVSVGGICVEIDRALEEGDLVQVVLFLVEDSIEAEGKTTLDLQATVQWSAEAERGFALGLRFVDPPDAKITMLEKVLTMITADAG
jgi:hypothetical protein